MENVLRFEHPEYLYGLIVIPLLILVYIAFRIGQKRRFERFAQIGMRDYLVPTYSTRRANFKFVIFLLVIACSILALANLQSGSKMEEVKREGIDLYLAIDVSNSMNAEDIVPSRLERSKQAINKLISEMKGDRIGVIVFADKAFVQLPITTDYSAAKMFLSTVNTSLVASQGTAIAEAINLAVKSFSDEEHSKAIVIISDGEDHENDAAVKAAQEAAKKGIRIYTIGMGLAEGAPIPEYNKYGQQIGYRKDKNGNYRELHTQLASESIDYTVQSNYRTDYIPKKNEGVQVISCPYFTTAVYDLTEPMTLDYSELDSFVVLLAVKGAGRLICNGEETSFEMGDSILFPATTKEVKVEGEVKFLETFV